MSTSVNSSSVKLKIFYGIELTAELKAAVAQSKRWKEAKVDPSILSLPLKEASASGKTFLGLFLEEETPQLSKVLALEAPFLQEMETLCPEIPTKAWKIKLFPQIFLN